MKTDVRDMAYVRTREFMVVWRNPATREFMPVGDLQITHRSKQIVRCRFVYRSDARVAPEFKPFLAFPDLDGSYMTKRELFPFFANRVMSARRPDYVQYLEALGLDAEHADPVEILARSTGERATDTVHVVPEADVLPDGTERRLFLVSGVRHSDSAEQRIAELRPGDELQLRREPENEANPRAILLDARAGEPVGWVPNYLLDYVHKHWESSHCISVFVERTNGPGVPWHLRLMCRMDVST